MDTIKTFTLLFLFLYVIIMLVIGYLGRKRSNTIEGFTLASSSVGGLLVGLSVFASWMSASTFMGVPAFFYQWGWPSFALSASVVTVTPLVLVFTIKKLRQAAKRMNVYTYTDLLSTRFDSTFIKLIVTLLSSFLFISIMIAQLRAIGLLFQTTIGIEYWQAVILGIVVSTLYILMGGMWASLITDGIQAVIMVITVLVLLPIGLIAVGGFNGLYEGLLNKGQSFVSFTEPTFWTPLTNSFQPLYWGLLIFAFPYVMNRCLTLKSGKEYKNFLLTFWASNAIGIFFIIAGGIALVLLPQTVEPDLASVALAIEILPTAVSGIILIGIFMAVMSSVDSVLHAAGTVIGNDFYRGIIAPARGKDPDSPEVKNMSVKLSQVFVVVFSIIPVYFAIFNPPEFLSLFLYWATGMMAAGTVAPLLIGLFWKKATTYSAIASIIAGVASYLSLDLMSSLTLYVNAPLAILVAAAVMIIVAVIENKIFKGYSLPNRALAKLNGAHKDSSGKLEEVN